MGVDYYACSVCSDTFSDHGDWGMCAKSECYLCGDCRDQMITKYGAVESEEDINYYGEETPKECDCCSDSIVNAEAIIEYLLMYSGLTVEFCEKEILANREREEVI